MADYKYPVFVTWEPESATSVRTLNNIYKVLPARHGSYGLALCTPALPALTDSIAFQAISCSYVTWGAGTRCVRIYLTTSFSCLRSSFLMSAVLYSPVCSRELLQMSACKAVLSVTGSNALGAVMPTPISP